MNIMERIKCKKYLIEEMERTKEVYEEMKPYQRVDPESWHRAYRNSMEILHDEYRNI